MATPPSVHWLAVETIRRVFSFLDLASLCGAAQICARWRSIVFDHPAYWGTIVISDVSPGPLARARHRMEQGGTRPMARFEVDYRQKHDHDDPVLKFLIPLLKLAVPRARCIRLLIESIYRLHVEDALCLAAPYLKDLFLYYAAVPRPELHRSMPLGYQKKLFDGAIGRLRAVKLYNIIIPKITIAAFANVDEVHFIHGGATVQNEFPCYLFDHFPNMTRLRMTGGYCWFNNAPLPRRICDAFARLAWVDLEFQASSITAFFRHLPMHELADLTICSPDEDGIYDTLEPMISFFDLVLKETAPKEEFLLTVKSRHTPRVRRFAEPLRYYTPGSPYANELLANEGFMGQVASCQIDLSLARQLRPWLMPVMTVLPLLILVLDEDTPFVVPLPADPLPCPALGMLVIQARYNHAYVLADELVAFAQRLTPERVKLELRRVLVDGSRELLATCFTSVEYSLARYPMD